MGKLNDYSSWEFLGTCSDRTLILGDPKYHCGPPVRERAFGNQVINKVLSEVHLTVGSVGPQTHLLAVFPVPNCIIGIDILSQNHSIGFLTSELRAVMLGNAKWKH